MAIEHTVSLEDHPGTLAELGAALGEAGVNIDALLGTTIGGEGVVQLVTDDPDAASRALDEGGFTYTTREVLIVNILDEPGTLGDVALVMSDADINIDSVYVTLKGTVVLGVDDLHGARQVAGGMAVM